MSRVLCRRDELLSVQENIKTIIVSLKLKLCLEAVRHYNVNNTEIKNDNKITLH